MALKKKFGDGYLVTVSLTDDASERDRDAIERLAKRMLQDVTPSYPAERVLKLRVPDDNADAMPEFFRTLEERRDELLIDDLLLSLTSMEEV